MSNRPAFATIPLLCAPVPPRLQTFIAANGDAIWKRKARESHANAQKSQEITSIEFMCDGANAVFEARKAFRRRLSNLPVRAWLTLDAKVIFTKTTPKSEGKFLEVTSDGLLYVPEEFARDFKRGYFIGCIINTGTLLEVTAEVTGAADYEAEADTEQAA